MPTVKRRSLILAALVTAAAVGGAGAWYATRADTASHGAVFAEGGVAIRGYDPVAYFTEGRPVAGRPEFEARHRGATWRFASAEHKAAFEADPARYEPQYGGYCAWAVSAKNEAYPIDPEAWKIVDGRLYLNFSRDVQADWERDVPGHITKANTNWPGLEARLAGG